MSLNDYKKLSQHIFRLLKVNEIIFTIARTSKGNLGIHFDTNNNDYQMYLDAVPLTTTDTLRDDNNIELKRMLEKYLFATPQIIVSAGYSTPQPSPKFKITPPDDNGQNISVSIAKPRGRPKSSKNKVKV